jgi:hypothetical protein
MTPFPRWLLTSLAVALSFFGTVRALGAETAAGKIKSIDLYMRTMVLVEDDGTEATMSLPEAIVVRPFDRQSQILDSLFSAGPVNTAPEPIEKVFPGQNLVPRMEYLLTVSQLRPDDEVVVVYDEDEDVRTVTEIRLKMR